MHSFIPLYFLCVLRALCVFAVQLVSSPYRHGGMMETVSYQREILVTKSVDVLVIGGGPAGLGAAIGAAKTGATTLLVERYGFLGGNATASLVGPFMTSYSADGTTQIIRGVFDELVRRMEAMGGAIHPSK